MLGLTCGPLGLGPLISSELLVSWWGNRFSHRLPCYGGPAEGGRARGGRKEGGREEKKGGREAASLHDSVRKAWPRAGGLCVYIVGISGVPLELGAI